MYGVCVNCEDACELSFESPGVDVIFGILSVAPARWIELGPRGCEPAHVLPQAMAEVLSELRGMFELPSATHASDSARTSSQAKTQILAGVRFGTAASGGSFRWKISPKGESMLSKCANPACSAPFRYLHEGRLFVTEIESEDRRLDCYWLCETCCRTLTVRVETGNGIMVKPAAPQRSDTEPQARPHAA
jgi:hypothetical protein